MNYNEPEILTDLDGEEKYLQPSIIIELLVKMGLKYVYHFAHSLTNLMGDDEIDDMFVYSTDNENKK